MANAPKATGAGAEKFQLQTGGNSHIQYLLNGLNKDWPLAIPFLLLL